MKFVKETVFAASVEDVWAFHERPGAFELLLPPWEVVRVVQPPTSLEVGTVVIVEQRIGPLWIRIEAEHIECDKHRVFVDVMRRGPLSQWRHEHRFEAADGGCRLRDAIEYAAPLGPLGRLFDPWIVRPRLQRLFDYRHQVTARELAAAASRVG